MTIFEFKIKNETSAKIRFKILNFEDRNESFPRRSKQIQRVFREL
jgi:hypothetical protein